MKNFKNLGTAISREQSKKIKGGQAEEGLGDDYAGTCCWHTSDWSEQQCNLTKSEAKAMQSQAGGLWCCASCL